MTYSIYFKNSRNWIWVFGATLFVVFSSSLFQIANNDIWWHLAHGKLIFTEGYIPRTETFSFTAFGTEQITHEWLFQCLVYVLYSIGGTGALIIFKAVIVTLTVFFVLRFVNKESQIKNIGAVFLLIPFILGGRIRYIIRPEIFTVLFTVLLLTALFRQRSRTISLRDLYWIPLLFIIWANLHPGIIVGIVILGLFALGRAIEQIQAHFQQTPYKTKHTRPGFGIGVALLGLSSLAGLVNPFFYRIYEVPFQLTPIYDLGIFLNAEWLPPQFPFHWLYFLALGATVLIVLLTFRHPVWAAILPLIFLAVISLRYVRNLALFCLSAPILLTALFTAFHSRKPTFHRVKFPHIRPGLVAGALVLLSISFIISNKPYKFGFGVDERCLPEAAVDFLEQTQPPGNIFNAHPFGGYLIWRLHPQKKVFIYSRDEIFVDMWRRIKHAVSDSRLWLQLLDEYKITHTLLRYVTQPEKVTVLDQNGNPKRVLWRPFAVNHFPPKKWALIYWDDTAMIHTRRTPATAKFIKRYEYKHIYPESVSFQLEAISMGWADREGAIRELTRKLTLDPGSTRARQLFTAIHQTYSNNHN